MLRSDETHAAHTDLSVARENVAKSARAYLLSPSADNLAELRAMLAAEETARDVFHRILIDGLAASVSDSL